jgi:hypothetical protein
MRVTTLGALSRDDAKLDAELSLLEEWEARGYRANDTLSALATAAMTSDGQAGYFANRLWWANRWCPTGGCPKLVTFTVPVLGALALGVLGAGFGVYKMVTR